MPGCNPKLPDIEEQDPTLQKYWRCYFVYGVCFWIVLATLLFTMNLYILDSTEGTFYGKLALVSLLLFLTAVPLVGLLFYLTRMHSILRHWQKSNLENVSIEEARNEP